MTKQLQPPTSRLVCMGSARALTQSIYRGVPELEVGGRKTRPETSACRRQPPAAGVLAMPERLFLRPDVHAAFDGDDLVFLDVAADSYACLVAAGTIARLAPTRNALEVNEPGLAADLRGAGLVLDAEPAGSARLGAPQPARYSAIAPEIPAPRPADLPEAARGLFDLARRYRGRSLTQIAGITARQRAREPEVTARLIEAVLRFHAWAPYAPISGKCLLRSFLLLRVLRRQGLDAFWVFGVRTWPFQAHCWLQVEDLVLDDHAERTWPYVPIMVL